MTSSKQPEKHGIASHGNLWQLNAYGLRCEINCLTVRGNVKNMASFSAPFQLKMSPSLCIYIPSPVQNAISMSNFTAPIMKPLPCFGIIGLKCSPFSKRMLVVNRYRETGYKTINTEVLKINKTS